LRFPGYGAPPTIVWQFARYQENSASSVVVFAGASLKIRATSPLYASVPIRPYMLVVRYYKIARTLRSRQNYDIRMGHISYSGHELPPLHQRRLLKS